MENVLILVGTRPEAIKLAIFYKQLQARAIRVTLCSSGQHNELIRLALEPFEITPDIEIQLNRKNSSLSELTSKLFSEIQKIFESVKPTLTIIQGDTTTALVGGMCSFYNRIPIAHIEAGLRTDSINSPFPEEINRRLISQFSDINFAPTDAAINSLKTSSQIHAKNFMVGNTVVDSLFYIQEKLNDETYVAKYIPPEVMRLCKLEKSILFTCHRRENHGNPMRSIARALLTLANQYDRNIIFPVHPNPIIMDIFKSEIGSCSKIHFIAPQNYPTFVMMSLNVDLIITDSGGLQEEAASLGVPFIVTREETERPEAIVDFEIQIVGASEEKIVSSVLKLINNCSIRSKLQQKRFPFGSGDASIKILNHLEAVGLVG